MASYLTPMQIMRLQNPLLRHYLSRDAYQIASEDKRFIYQILGMVRQRAGHISRREAYNRGTIMVSVPLKKGITKGTALDIDTSTNNIIYRDKMIGLGEDRTKYMLSKHTGKGSSLNVNTKGVAKDLRNEFSSVIDGVTKEAKDTITKGKETPTRPTATRQGDESEFVKDSDGKGIVDDLHYMWSLSADHDYAHPDICDELAGRVYKGSDINSGEVTRPHLHCKCTMACMESNPMSDFLTGGSDKTKMLMGSDGKVKGLHELVDMGVDRGLDLAEGALMRMGPQGELLAMGLNLGEDVISDFLSDQITSLLDESPIWRDLSNIIQTINMAIELKNTFTSTMSNVHNATEFLMEQDITELGSKLRNKVINDSKDRLNQLLLSKVKILSDVTNGMDKAHDIMNLYESLNSKFNSATKLSDGIDILNDGLQIADKLGIKTNKYINKKMLNSTKATLVFTEDTLANTRGTGLILF